MTTAGEDQSGRTVTAGWRTLILVRHAKAARPPGTPDHERPLTADGLEAARRLSAQLVAAGRIPDVALVSTARRAQETWLALREGWPAQWTDGLEVRNEPALYKASATDVMAQIRDRTRTGSAFSVLVCGHEPSISATARELLGPDGLRRAPWAAATVENGMATATAAVLTSPGGWTSGPDHPGGEPVSLELVLGSTPQARLAVPDHRD